MKLLTLNEASRLLALHPSTVTKYAQRGKLPGLLLGRRFWRFPDVVLHLWLALEQEERTAAGLRAGIEAYRAANGGSGEQQESMWSVRQAARFLQLSATVVYRHLTPDNELGATIPGLKIGNKWRISRRLLEAWLLEEVVRHLAAVEKEEGAGQGGQHEQSKEA
jgi:excisionase family DNA binding protein